MQSVRGFQDIHKQDAILFDIMNAKVLSFAQFNCFESLHLPIIEFEEIFANHLGDDSDVVSKEMYSFVDKSDNRIVLRPEFTASVMRYAVENSLDKQVLPKKFFSFGPLFRYDRPQKGRYRQFHQYNFEILGASNESHTDVYGIFLASELIKKLEVQNVILNVNILPKNIELYKKKLYDYLSNKNLSDISKHRLSKNVLRILDSKEECDIEILKNAPRVTDFLEEEELKYRKFIAEQLQELKIDFEFNDNLVRGLDYYNSVVFEFIQKDLGLAVLGGGRYNNLFTNMSNGRTLPAFGFAAGVERLMLATNISAFLRPKLGIICADEECLSKCLQMINSLQEMYDCDLILNGSSITKQIKKADQLKYEFISIIGTTEIQKKEMTIKELSTGVEKIVKYDY